MNRSHVATAAVTAVVATAATFGGYAASQGGHVAKNKPCWVSHTCPAPSPSPTVSPTLSPTPVPTISPSPTATPSGTVYAVPTSVPHDCATPATSALTSWLLSLPSGVTAQLAAVCYAANGTITLPDRSGLTIDGNGATIKLIPGTGNGHTSLIDFLAGSNVTVKNLTLLGENPSTASPSSGCAPTSTVSNFEWEHGIYFHGTNGGLVDHLTIRHVCGDFVEADFDPRVSSTASNFGAGAKNIVVQNSTFDGAGRMGFGVTSFVGFKLLNSTVSNVNMTAVDVELDFAAETGQHLLVQGNQFANVRHALLANAGSGFYPNINDLQFIGNKDSTPVTCQPPVISTYGSDPYYRNQFVIQNNVLTSWGAAFDLTRVHTATISGNQLTLKSGGGCTSGSVAIVLSHDVTITGTGNTTTGFSQLVSSDSTDSGVSVS